MYQVSGLGDLRRFPRQQRGGDNAIVQLVFLLELADPRRGEQHNPLDCRRAVGVAALPG